MRFLCHFEIPERELGESAYTAATRNLTLEEAFQARYRKKTIPPKILKNDLIFQLHFAG